MGQVIGETLPYAFRVAIRLLLAARQWRARPGTGKEATLPKWMSAIGSSSLARGQMAVAVVVFTVLAACSVAVPVVAYAVAHDRMRRPLDELKVWLQANNTAVMAVLLLVIGVVLVGKGIGGL